MVRKMQDNTLTNKIFGISEFVFKICFLAYGLATFNSFFAHTKIISVLLLLTTASAGITLIYRLINIRRFIHNKMLWLSLAFMVSYIISLFINIRYVNINGIKTLAFMGMEFFLLLATDERKKFDKYKVTSDTEKSAHTWDDAELYKTSYYQESAKNVNLSLIYHSHMLLHQPSNF